MVSSHVPDALYKPTQVIQSLWNAAKETQPDAAKLIDDFPQAVEAHFRGVVNSETGLKEIHSPRTRHELELLPQGALVRMRLMIQDNSISPEIYLAQHDGLPGGWSVNSVTNIPDNLDYSKLRERHIFWAVRVPGESDWVSCLLGEATESPAKSTAEIQHNSHPHKSPHGELGLQLKIYGQAPKLSPTDVSTFVGILDREVYVGSQSDDSSLIPTLHVVYWTPNPSTLLQESDFASLQTTDSDTQANWETLIDRIAGALGGDLDAAKWVVLCMVSGRPNSKSPTNSPISLTLTGFPPAPTCNAVPTIATLLAQLFPMVSHIPLNLDILNSTNMAPFSEASQEDLSAGRLQLPSGSLVIFDERVEEGKLVERGVENVRIIQDVLEKQTLAYRFPYSSFDFRTNISPLILTEGKKEALFVKTELCVPVRPSVGSDLYTPPPPLSDSFRQLVFRLKTANQSGVKAAPTLTEHVQDMFVRDRQAERASGGRKDDSSAADEYGLRMRLSKAMALALGLSEISCDVFDQTVELDKRRIQRLQDIPLGSRTV